jgi:hypothetical protein
MRIRLLAAAFICTAALSACSDASLSPTATPRGQAAHQNGLVLGSGNRTADSTAANGQAPTASEGSQLPSGSGN